MIDANGNLLLGGLGTVEPWQQGAYQKGPTSIDIAGEAIELCSELSGHRDLAAGNFAVTHRLDRVAGISPQEYTTNPDFSVPFRMICPALGEVNSAPA